MAIRRARYRVAHSPTANPAVGNWAVKHRSTGRIISRHRTQAAANRKAAGRGARRRRGM